jgi:hypothetical protein
MGTAPIFASLDFKRPTSFDQIFASGDYRHILLRVAGLLRLHLLKSPWLLALVQVSLPHF